MTNSPIFEQRLAINVYRAQLDDTAMLPTSARSVVRNVSVPFGISTPDEPSISSTRWRRVAHHTRKLYLFESALTPNVFWIDLNKLDSGDGAPVRKPDLDRDESNSFAGESSASFVPTEPFTFLGIKP